MIVRRVIVFFFFFYYANVFRTLSCVRVSLGFAVACEFLCMTTYRPPLLGGAAYQGAYDCITILGWLSQMAYCASCILSYVVDNGLMINHCGNVLAYRHIVCFVCFFFLLPRTMTNSGWACKKEGVALPRRADTRYECIRPMYYSTVAFFHPPRK